MARIPLFYNTFHPQINETKMRFCQKFVAAVGVDFLPETILLRNRSGERFRVKLSKENGQVYFERGWEIFVDRNRLLAGYYMVFRYDGRRTFDVTIFDYSACEKEDEEDDSQQVDRDELSLDDEDVYDDDQNEDEEPGSDSEDFVTDSSDDRSYEACSENSRHEALPTKSRKCIDAGSKKRTAPGRKPYPKHEWVDADAELLVEQNKLYFVIRGRCQKRKNQVPVPGMVLRDFDVELDDRISYWDPKGRKYVGRVSKWKTRQVWIGGWASFCGKNQISTEDKCICEFLISGSSKCSSMRVHIIRDDYK